VAAPYRITATDSYIGVINEVPVAQGFVGVALGPLPVWRTGGIGVGGWSAKHAGGEGEAEKDDMNVEGRFPAHAS
jgi:hypothetical protein